MFSFEKTFASRPVLLAPMEDVSDAVFRKLCRELGADVCYTEFVNVDSLMKGCLKSRKKLTLAKGDQPTAIQIYGADPQTLAEAASVAEAAEPAFIDINAGCWLPKIVSRGAGAGWLRDPIRMVEMAKLVVERVGLPVTVKTRIGWGPESEMPIVDLARRLEDVGVRALTIHCRTALMRHEGPADWSWARKAREAVRIPVVVNGDVRTAADCARALDQTGCAAVMVARGAMEHPWVFREARALLDRGEILPGPTVDERLALLARQMELNVAHRNEKNGVECVRRHLRGYLREVPDSELLREALNRSDYLAPSLAIIEEARGARRAA